jgi:lipopolysaccharide exporter
LSRTAREPTTASLVTATDRTPTLAARAARGAAWTLPTSLGTRLIGLVGTLLLARYLTPAEYGEVSAASILMLTASSITTAGVGIYLVANPTTSRAETFHATCWFLAIGVAAIAVAWGLGGRLAGWFEAPQMARFLPAFAVVSVLERGLFLPERMLVRELRFGWLSLARGLGELTFTGVSVVLAVLGFGGMAIAWGNVARSALRFAAIVPAVDRRAWLEPHRLRLATMRRIVGYGSSVSVASVATFGMRRWDNLLISHYFGPASMGAYNYAYNLADTPAVTVGEQLSDVVGASFPHAAHGTRAAALVRACELVSMIMFPLAFGLGVVAPTVVEAFFDQRWASVGTMLVLLSVLSAPRPLANILYAYFYACDRPNVVALLEWLSLAAIIGGIATVGRMGINWSCAVVGAVFVLRTAIAIVAVRRQDGIPLSGFLKPMAGPFVACIAMVTAIVIARPVVQPYPATTRLFLEVALGTLVYVVGVLTLARSQSRELLRLVRLALFGDGRG